VLSSLQTMNGSHGAVARQCAGPIVDVSPGKFGEAASSSTAASPCSQCSSMDRDDDDSSTLGGDGRKQSKKIKRKTKEVGALLLSFFYDDGCTTSESTSRSRFFSPPIFPPAPLGATFIVLYVAHADPKQGRAAAVDQVDGGQRSRRALAERLASRGKFSYVVFISVRSRPRSVRSP